MRHVIFFCYIAAIMLGIAGFTIGTLAERKKRTSTVRAMQLFMGSLLIMCVYDMVIYYTDYILAGYHNVELMRIGDCIIAVLFFFWLILQQKLVGESILEGYYFGTKVYVALYAAVWAVLAIFFEVEVLYELKWLLVVSDIMLILLMLIGSVTYIVAACYKKADRSMTIIMTIVTAMIMFNYISYFWGETSVYWGNSDFIRQPLDFTIVYWFIINIAMMVLIYKQAFVPAYAETEGEEKTKTLDERLEELQGIFGLTEREKDLVALIYEGHSNAEIAEELFISESTVKTHIYNIFRKMGIKNRMSVMKIVRGEEDEL